MKNLIYTVPVIGEEGQLANVYIYQKLFRLPALHGGRQPGRHRPGIKDMRDEFGRSVKLIDKDTFRVVATGEILVRN